jgi:ABC-type glycerol-3-phosphate transport system permease component
MRAAQQRSSNLFFFAQRYFIEGVVMTGLKE